MWTSFARSLIPNLTDKRSVFVEEPSYSKVTSLLQKCGTTVAAWQLNVQLDYVIFPRPIRLSLFITSGEIIFSMAFIPR